ncbi:hypothetical protein BI347_11220 [Chromobacterium sphagni]|uniref:Flagellar Assembly Protein A N-terminal region domain-containing protein n=1 Tax=Chromobacterium sphagni TaxID=1903179 RepID=A0A1S1X3F9_9NEIS|nr:flagellar assembly protein A [Chromobacterium sphagni]OHX14014.1 hypothetical protein BI347_11220 [Chromobacterium sphagni]
MSDFFQVRDDGLFIAPGVLASAGGCLQAIDQLFAAGFYLSGLNYSQLCHYAYDFDPANVGSAPPQRIAQSILPFPEERRSLYRGVSEVEGGAEYLFEQIYLTQSVEVPVYGKDQAGHDIIVGSREEVYTAPTQLQFDELVAYLWQQGVRFGLNEAAIGDILAQGKTGRYRIASPRPPVPGVDAGVKEQTTAMHRDDHPRTLADGRVDLTQFQNRYPQIKANTVLLMKTPCIPGRPGRAIDGGLISAAEARDFELDTLGGTGTEVRIDKDGNECIVAVNDGFLNIDSATNQISVVDKIVNRDGVSVRTTGDLALQGDEYEEHGEVQERRTVTGKNLTMFNNVYGTVRSTGGRILLKENLVGGVLLNDAGPISVEGLVSNAQVRAEHGEITLNRAENALVIARKVRIAEASCCVILAEDVDIERAMGCAIAAKQLHIGKAGARANQETAISILLPDLSGFTRKLEALQKQEQDCLQKIETMQKARAALAETEELKRYFGLAARLKKGELQLSAEQQASWKRMSEQLAPKLKQLSQLNAGLKSLQDAQSAIGTQTAELDAAREAAEAGIRCKLEELTGETIVRALTLPVEAPALAALPLDKLRARLRTSDAQTVQLFADHEGCFTWRYTTRRAN